MADMIVTAEYPDITHNPWAPAYALSPDGSEKAKRELAPLLRDDLMALYPDTRFGSVRFGGVGYAGWVRA